MKRHSFLSFVLGLLSGVIIGMLIAPDSGSNTIDMIKTKSKDTNENIKKKVNDAKYDISGVTDTIKDTITLYTGKSIQEPEGQTYFEKEFDV